MGIDVTRDEFNALAARVDDIEADTKAVKHLVVGGINTHTGLVDPGITQSLAELVLQMKATNRRIDEFVENAKRLALRTGTWVGRSLGVGIGALVVSGIGWLVHLAFASISTITTTATHTVTTTVH